MFPAKEATKPATEPRDSAPILPHPSEPLPPRSPCLGSLRPTRQGRVPGPASARAPPSTSALGSASRSGIPAGQALVSGPSRASLRLRPRPRWRPAAVRLSSSSSSTLGVGEKASSVLARVCLPAAVDSSENCQIGDRAGAGGQRSHQCPGRGLRRIPETTGTAAQRGSIQARCKN